MKKDNICLAFGFAGMALAGVGLWSAIALHVGADPFDGVNYGGVCGFAVCVAFICVERATRWQRLSQEFRAVCRMILLAGMSGTIVATLVALGLSLTGPTHAGGFLAVVFSVLAALCEVGFVIWFFRANDERSRKLT